MSEQLAAAITSYLYVSEQHRALVCAETPLNRRVELRAATWRPWLTEGGYPTRPSYCGELPPQRTEAAVALLDGLPRVDPPPRRRDVYVDRPKLQELAVVARRGGSRELIGMWVATMMWGSGTSNGRGPWRTAQGLSAPNLAEVLELTASLVRDGDLTDAYRAFDVPGSGESFFTKWLWATSLADPTPAVRPLILDKRVRRTLRPALPDEARFRGAAGYGRYVDIVHQAVERLRNDFEHIDAEKVEWLLFDRPDRGRVGHSDCTEPCFAIWVTDRQVSTQ